MRLRIVCLAGPALLSASVVLPAFGDEGGSPKKGQKDSARAAPDEGGSPKRSDRAYKDGRSGGKDGTRGEKTKRPGEIARGRIQAKSRRTRELAVKEEPIMK